MLRRKGYHEKAFTPILSDHGGGKLVVSRGYPVWGAAVSRSYARKIVKKPWGFKRGQYWPVLFWSADKQETRNFISDAYANKDWPKGFFVIVRAYHTALLHDGVFL